MLRNEFDAIHRLSKSEDWIVFSKLIKESWDKYVAKIFELNPKHSQINLSMKDLFIFYVKFCENCINLPQNIVQDYVEWWLENMENSDIDEYVDNIVDSVMKEAQEFMNK